VSTSSQQRLQQHARDSVAPESLCVVRLNDGLAQCECWWSDVKLQWMTYQVCSSSSNSSIVCGPTTRRTHSRAYTKA